MLNYEEAMSFTKEVLNKQLFRVLRTNKFAFINKEKKKQNKSLHLVLDLDHTLVHSILVSELSEKEKYLIEEADSRLDLWTFNKGYPTEFFIKLRPFVHEFLEEANKLYSLSVYTTESFYYAQAVLSLIDPTKLYFGDRVITREQSPYNNKTLDLVAVDQRRVVILDDTRYVWPFHKRNLLKMSKYIYFRDRFDSISPSYAEEKQDESQCNGTLANVLLVLKSVHKRFQYSNKDLRLLIREPCKTW